MSASLHLGGCGCVWNAQQLCSVSTQLAQLCVNTNSKVGTAACSYNIQATQPITSFSFDSVTVANCAGYLELVPNVPFFPFFLNRSVQRIYTRHSMNTYLLYFHLPQQEAAWTHVTLGSNALREAWADLAEARKQWHSLQVEIETLHALVRKRKHPSHQYSYLRRQMVQQLRRCDHIWQ